MSSRSMELPVSWADWLTNLAKRTGDNWTSFKLWLARRTSGQGA
jgi:lipopolysaccharide export system permease protein